MWQLDEWAWSLYIRGCLFLSVVFPFDWRLKDYLWTQRYRIESGLYEPYYSKSKAVIINEISTNEKYIHTFLIIYRSSVHADSLPDGSAWHHADTENTPHTEQYQDRTAHNHVCRGLDGLIWICVFSKWCPDCLIICMANNSLFFIFSSYFCNSLVSIEASVEIIQ